MEMAARRINRSRDRVTERVAVIAADREAGVEGVIAADVEERGQTRLSAGRTTCIAERARLECASSRVPEVACVREIQRVHVAAEREILARAHDRFAEGV